MELADALAEHLGTPGNGTALSRARRDKATMTAAVRAAGLRTLPFLRSDDPAEILAWWRTEAGGAPGVVKPQRAARGAGVWLCEAGDPVAAAAASLLGMLDLYGQQGPDSVLVQRLAHGPLFEVCTVSQGGQHDVVMVVESTKQGSVWDAMRIVHEDEMAALGEVCRYALAVLDALEIGYGAAHVEVMVDEGRPVLIECAARLIGLISPSLCSRPCWAPTRSAAWRTW